MLIEQRGNTVLYQRRVGLLSALFPLLSQSKELLREINSFSRNPQYQKRNGVTAKQFLISKSDWRQPGLIRRGRGNFPPRPFQGKSNASSGATQPQHVGKSVGINKKSEI